MNTSLTITIKKRTQTYRFLWLLIVLPFFFALLTELLGLPYFLRYSLDVTWALLLVFSVMGWQQGIDSGTKIVFRVVLVYVIYTAVSYVAQFQSLFFYLWGARNAFRFYAAFFAFAMFLKKDDIQGFFKLFDVLFWVNVAVSMVQYFAFDLKGDHLGGLFGVDSGANAYTMIFFLIVLTKDLLDYLEKRVSFRKFLFKCVAALLVVSLAEIKFFFILIGLIVLLATFFTNFTWRKFWAAAVSIAAILLFVPLLEKLFGFEGFFSVEYLLDMATSDKGYTGRNDINRLNAIAFINDEWLLSGAERLFGIGLGNADTAGYEFLVTPFFELYGQTHYLWFSYATVYLETGWIGLILYFGFFLAVYFSILQIEHRSDGMLKSYCRLGRIITICCIIFSIYNSSLRSEAGYMAFFVLAVPFALDREKRAEERRVQNAETKPAA